MRIPKQLQSKISNLRDRPFAMSMSKLIGGTAGSQLVGIAVLPLLTRVYSPADFESLAAYAAIVSILSVVACLRYDFAIPLPKSTFAAVNLLVLSLCATAVTSVLVAILVIVFQTLGHSVQLKLGGMIWLVPVGVALAGAYSAAQLWASRRGSYGAIARTRVAQVGGGAIVQLLLGLIFKSPIGLIIGHALAGGIGGLGLLKSAWKAASAQIKKVSLRSMRATAVAYGSFPKYSIIDGLSTNAGAQLPILLIATWSNGPEAGYLLLATKIIAAPVTMVSGAASQIFLATAPEKMRQGCLGEFAASVSRNLILLMSVPLVIFGLVATPLIETLFGQEWGRTANIVLWLIPWYSMRLLSAPLSMVMNVKGRQKEIMHMKVWALIFRVGAVVLAYYLLRSRMVEVLAVASFIVYLFFGIVFLRAAGVTTRTFFFGPARGR